jgi:hypothetical protein
VTETPKPRASTGDTDAERQVVYDWTDEPLEKAAAKAPETQIETPGAGSLEMHRETTRGQLARWLMALLSVTVGTILLLGGLQMADILDGAKISVQDLAQAVLTPVVTLTGTALGFYFGAQTAGKNTGGTIGNWPKPREPGKVRKFYRWLW